MLLLPSFQIRSERRPHVQLFPRLLTDQVWHLANGKPNSRTPYLIWIIKALALASKDFARYPEHWFEYPNFNVWIAMGASIGILSGYLLALKEPNLLGIGKLDKSQPTACGYKSSKQHNYSITTWSRQECLPDKCPLSCVEREGRRADDRKGGAPTVCLDRLQLALSGNLDILYRLHL